jgi:release factor glutamine methyltransferase
MAALRGATVADALDGGVTAIAAAGCDTPRLDAEVLLAWAIGVDRTALVMHPERELEPAAARAFRDAVSRRSVRREPVAYITGRRAFRHIELAVDPRVLIPRPETETLVEAALGALAAGASVLDVGTGSGAVALALKHERPDLRIAGSDASAEALAVAHLNGARLGLEVDWINADLLEDAQLRSRRLDVIVSNPPYVSEGERPGLAPEIVAHEPAGALFAGPDGLAVIGPLIAQAAARDDVALIALEVGHDQAAAVVALAREAGFPATEIHRDLAGVERVVVARRERP